MLLEIFIRFIKLNTVLNYCASRVSEKMRKGSSWCVETKKTSGESLFLKPMRAFFCWRQDRDTNWEKTTLGHSTRFYVACTCKLAVWCLFCSHSFTWFNFILWWKILMVFIHNKEHLSEQSQINLITHSVLWGDVQSVKSLSYQGVIST